MRLSVMDVTVSDEESVCVTSPPELELPSAPPELPEPDVSELPDWDCPPEPESLLWLASG